MLHAPQSVIIESSHLWDVLVEQRSRFYTKNLKAFVGYARKQAAKYGIKGSRLADVRRVTKFLEKTLERTRWETTLKLRDVWDHLPKGEHIHFHEDVGKTEMDFTPKFQETARLNYVLPILAKFLTEYGVRAQQAEQNQGVDWKAISHALRAAYQVEELLQYGTMTLPSPLAPLLLSVKKGLMDTVL
jgi:hypothetical protein